MPVIKLGTHLTEQLAAPLFISSFMIIVYAWAFSGPVTAAVLTFLCAMISVYLALSVKEPSLLLQVLVYAAFFNGLVFYLYKIQKITNDKIIEKEKKTEEIHLTDEELAKKNVLKKALEQKITRFLGLQKFSDELKNIPQLQQAAKIIVREIYRVFGKADDCLLYLVNESEQGLYLVASTRADEGIVIKEKEASIFDEWVMKRSQAIMIEDVLNDFRFSTESEKMPPNMRSLCASPLVTENKVLGVVRINSSKQAVFNADDLRLLDVISGLGAVTLRNLLLYARMEELAIRDSLTGLYVNRYFQERLSEEIARAFLDKTSFSLILLDIDFFKRYNDEYGHSAGDLVLRNISALISRCVEPSDIVARYGGEEFIVLLPNRKKKEAVLFAEKIRTEIEKNKFMLRRAEGRVTASIGVATFPDEGRTKEEIVWTVDKKMYKAKSLGRNQVYSR